MLPVTPTSTSLGYQPGLDGLRGVFVVAVLFFHGGFSWATGGYLGVSAFFTLSGFLICSLIIDERARTGGVDLVHFWKRRARRLLPAAWIALAMALAYGYTLGSPTAQRALQGDILSALGYVANWRFVFTESSYEALFSEPSPVAHLWSLAIEEQYYLVFPLLVVGVLALARGRRSVLAMVLGALTAGSAILMVVLHDPGADTGRVYYGTDTRAAELLVGAVAALGWRHISSVPGRIERFRRVDPWLQGVAGLVLVGLVMAWSRVPVSSDGLYRGGLLLHALGVVVLVLAALRPGPVRAVASFEPLRRLGLISYGVYLYHWPIFLWLNVARTGLEGWTLFALRCGVTLLVSAISYLLVEQPVRTGVAVRGRGLVVAPLAAIAIIAAAVAAPAPEPTLMQAASFGAEIDPFADVEPEALPTRDESDDPEVPRISVFGDSTAIGPFYGLLDVDSTTGEVIVVPGRMVLGCGLVRAEAIRSLGQVYPLTETCSTWPELWPSILTKSDPDIAVVLFGPWDASDHRIEGRDEWVALGDPEYDKLARTEIERALELLTNEVDLVVWLTSPPINQTHGQLNSPPDPASEPERIERWNELVRAEVESYPSHRATVVDLNGWFQALPNGPFDETIRPDGVHIAESEAPQVGRWLADEILSEWSARASSDAEPSPAEPQS